MKAIGEIIQDIVQQCADTPEKKAMAKECGFNVE